MKNIFKVIYDKIPKPDSFSLSWAPSINFPIRKDKERNTLRHFEELIEKGLWKKEFVHHKEIWVCESDNTFQIEKGDCGDEFRESWNEVYPAPVGQRYSVYLRINNATIKELLFISCDGGRIFVPIPEKHFEDDKAIYTWKRNSLPLKVCKIIGHYYIYKNIEGIARVSKIQIL